MLQLHQQIHVYIIEFVLRIGINSVLNGDENTGAPDLLQLNVKVPGEPSTAQEKQEKQENIDASIDRFEDLYDMIDGRYILQMYILQVSQDIDIYMHYGQMDTKYKLFCAMNEHRVALQRIGRLDQSKYIRS